VVHPHRQLLGISHDLQQAGCYSVQTEAAKLQLTATATSALTMETVRSFETLAN
jgi:hypothetical protein